MYHIIPGIRCPCHGSQNGKSWNVHSLSRDEFFALIQEAAKIVNRTPLCEVSSDPNDPFPVSPSTLLIMRDEPSDSPPELFSEKDILQYGKLRWRRVQFLADQFWIRWKRNYISTIQARNKWRSVKINLKPGDIVLVRDKSPRNSWPLARIVSVKVSKDDLVRSVILQLKPSAAGTPRSIERAIHDLVLLVPAEEESIT